MLNPKNGSASGQSLLAGVLLLAALLIAVASPAAHAETIDDRFVSALTTRGITFGSPQAEIATGHQVCGSLDLGTDTLEVAHTIMKSKGLSPHDAGFVIGASIGAYCPEHTQ